MSQADVVVIGAGVMGRATALALVRRGASVVVLEQFGPVHSRGSSHGASRIIREAYFEHPDYVPLVRRAYQGWRELELDGGRPLVNQVGAVYVGAPESELISGTDRAAAEQLVTIQPFDADHGISIPEGETARYEPGAGFLRADLAMAALMTRAQALGAEFRFDCRVNGLTFLSNAVRIDTNDGAIDAGTVVQAQGPFTSRRADLPLRVTRQTVVYTGVDLSTQQGFPVVAAQFPDGGFVYSIPAFPGSRGFKTARHDPGPEVDPQEADPLTEEITAVATVEPYWDRYIPAARGRVTGLENCRYTLTPDANFVVDHHPELPPCIMLAGFSGHGFKFAPAIGEIAADFALEGKTEESVAFLSSRRFRTT